MPRPAHGALGLSFLACRAMQFVCLVVAMSMIARLISVMVDSMQQPPPPLVGVLSVVCFSILYVVITIILYWDGQLPLLPTAAMDGLFFIALMTTSIIIGKPLSYVSCKGPRSGNAKTFVESLASNLNRAPTPAPTPTAAFSPYAEVTAAAQPATKTAISYVTSTISDAAATVAATLAPGSESQVLGTDGRYYSITPSRLFRRDSEESDMQAISYSAWIRGATKNHCLMMKGVWGFGIALTILFIFSVACLAFIWKRERDPKLPQKSDNEQ